MLAIRVALGAAHWSVRALVDTGAPFTLFDRGTGDALGIDFSRADARRERHKIAGDEYVAQVEVVELSVPPFNDLCWETEVGFFLDDWGMPFAGLLGQEGFLDRWVLSFDFPHSFIIEEQTSFIERIPPISQDEQEILWEWQELGWKGPPGYR